MEFMCVPDTYYDQLRERLKHSKVKISEDLDVLQVRIPSYSNEFMFCDVMKLSECSRDLYVQFYRCESENIRFRECLP